MLVYVSKQFPIKTSVTVSICNQTVPYKTSVTVSICNQTVPYKNTSYCYYM